MVALGLGEWQELMTKHGVRGDNLFQLNDDRLSVMGVWRIGDRLFLVKSLQSVRRHAWPRLPTPGHACPRLPTPRCA